MSTLGEAAFRTRPFTVQRAGLDLVFTHRPASEWIADLVTDHYPVRILQSMEARSYEQMMDAAEAGRITRDDLVPLAHQALAEAGGRVWWETANLVGAVVREPTGRLLGELVLAGVRPETMTLAAYCAAVWARLVQNADATQLMKLEAQLTMPPAGVPLDEMPDDTDDFAATAQRLQNMPGIRTG